MYCKSSELSEALRVIDLSGPPHASVYLNSEGEDFDRRGGDRRCLGRGARGAKHRKTSPIAASDLPLYPFLLSYLILVTDSGFISTVLYPKVVPFLSPRI